MNQSYSTLLKTPPLAYWSNGPSGKRSVTQSLVQIAQTVNDMNLTLIMDVQTANLPTLDLTDIERVKIVKRGLIGEICDLVIVVGGDGSILHAAEALARYRVPVLGVNRGRLGFLADVKPDELPSSYAKY